MRTGIAELPLHPGKCPRWLFPRMVGLAEGIVDIIVFEYGTGELLRRLSDPFFFQSLGCALAFDWHSSGLTTTTCGALKEAINPETHGMAVAGGKGRASRKTPQEIERISEMLSLSTISAKMLIYSSRMSAKVDNSCVQDGYNLYHHSFLFSESGDWCVVQQGLNPENRYARRYHWLSNSLTDSFVEEPHSAICSQQKEKHVLDMTSKRSEEARKVSVDLVKDNPRRLLRLCSIQKDLSSFIYPNKRELKLHMHSDHMIFLSRQTFQSLQKAYEIQPQSYEELVSIQGVGPASIRALALISGLIYGKAPSWNDPAKYSFSHGGKDGIPFEVDRKTMDKSMEILKAGIEEAKVGQREKLHALRRLSSLMGSSR